MEISEKEIKEGKRVENRGRLGERREKGGKKRKLWR